MHNHLYLYVVYKIFVTTKGVTHLYLHIYLEIATAYYKYMIDTFLKYHGMYCNSFNIEIMLNI